MQLVYCNIATQGLRRTQNFDQEDEKCEKAAIKDIRFEAIRLFESRDFREIQGVLQADDGGGRNRVITDNHGDVWRSKGGRVDGSRRQKQIGVNERTVPILRYSRYVDERERFTFLSYLLQSDVSVCVA